MVCEVHIDYIGVALMSDGYCLCRIFWFLIMFIAEVNSSRTNLSPFTKGYRGLASRMQLVSNLLKGSPHGDPLVYY